MFKLLFKRLQLENQYRLIRFSKCHSRLFPNTKSLLYYFLNIVLLINYTSIRVCVKNILQIIAINKKVIVKLSLYNICTIGSGLVKHHKVVFGYFHFIQIITKLLAIASLKIPSMFSVNSIFLLWRNFLYHCTYLEGFFQVYSFNNSSLTSIMTRNTPIYNISKSAIIYIISKIKRNLAQDLNNWYMKVFLDFLLVSLNYCSYITNIISIIRLNIFIVCVTLSPRSLIKVSFHTTFYQLKLLTL